MPNALIYFDLETGGLDWTIHPIIQIAAVATGPDGAITDEFEAKLQFDPATATPEALAINAYTPEAWIGAEPEADVLHRFASWLELHGSVPKTAKKGRQYLAAALAGHNASTFDFPFLQHAYRRHNIFLPAAFPVFDTMQAAFILAMVRGRPFNSYKLAELCKEFNIPLDQAHHALYDVRATAQLGKILLGALRAP